MCKVEIKPKGTLYVELSPIPKIALYVYVNI